MNTIERLNYLVHFPKLLPPVPCVFVTKSRSVKGFLVKKTEDSIEIKQFNDTNDANIDWRTNRSENDWS